MKMEMRRGNTTLGDRMYQDFFDEGDGVVLQSSVKCHRDGLEVGVTMTHDCQKRSWNMDKPRESWLERQNSNITLRYTSALAVSIRAAG